MNEVASPVDWYLAEVWNAVAMKPQKPLEKRDYAYASELGAPFYDRYLKMNAVPFTNPPTARSLRKFLAGNLFEHIVKQILIAAGVYKRDEVRLDEKPYKDAIAVHGRCDFKTVNGFVDPGEALTNLEALSLPGYLRDLGSKLIRSLEGVYLKEKILELKSVSSFAMDRVEQSGKAIPNHCLQAYHYQKNGNIQADICYCCRDDMRMRQFVLDVATCEARYRKDLEIMTQYLVKKKVPPKDPLCSFDELLGRFTKNLGVEYSPYLSHYGFNTPDDFRLAVSFVERWNRALNRFVLAEMGMSTPTGKPITITAKNKEVQAEIEKAGYNFKKLLKIKIALGAVVEEPEM